jgi:GTP pyrophosphokinase
MIRIDDILDTVLAYNPEADQDLIKKAYVYSAKVHLGQVRLSGEPYLVHPLEVAAILAQLKLDTATIVTGLLHDTVEDTYASPEEIESLFGQEVAFLVGGVTKISRITMESTEEDQAENYRKMILAMVRDIRVILVKLADRLHNMRTLEFQPTETQSRIAEETLDIYAPMAHRLGIESIKSELEGLAFRYLHPDIYKDLEKRLAKKERERERYVDEVVRIITKKLYEYGLVAEVTGRPKRIYSIYRKMQTQNLDFEQVYDLIGFRIIVNSYKECYEALGIIHSMWKPVPGKFKDYINLPKANMYQSLHITVIGHYGETVEIQIRTHDMHRVAEDGIAAHWKYKEDKAFQEEEEKQFQWLRQLLEWQADLKDSKEFLETIKLDLYPNDVYVFTPRGEVKEFPRGATPVDFAYSIHTDVGHRCIGAKVNSRIVPLSYELKSGERVEILTSATHTPSKDWLNFVQTSRAKAKIRQWIKAEERERSVTLGKAILEKDFRKFNLNFSRILKSGEMTKAAKEFSFHEVDDLLASVGYGKISPKQVMGRLVPSERLERERKREETRLARLIKRVKKSHDAIIVKGVGNVMISFAGCCNPVPGDNVIGYITRGRGVTVHRADCSNILNSDSERRVEVEWDLDKDYAHPVRIRVLSSNRKGLLADISGSLSSNGVNIVNAHVTTADHDRAVSTFQIEIRDLRHLQRVTRSLERIKGVLQVKRLRL